MADNMIFDSHAHFDSEQFDEDRDELLMNLHLRSDAAGVGKIVNVGANIRGSLNSIGLAEKYEFIYAAVGVHPDDAGEICYLHEAENGLSSLECAKNFRLLQELALNPQTVAIGEIGLDYHWNVWPKEIQREAFVKQWELALKADLPVIIHSREAAEDTMKIVKNMYARNGEKLQAVMHCYSYGVEQAREYMDMGLLFGIGGVVTFSNARKLKEVVDFLPLNKIMLETDCPYMAPEPFRGKRNDSGMLTLVAEKIAEIKQLPVETVLETTCRNAREFFKK